jgi:hypothetical protein
LAASDIAGQWWQWHLEARAKWLKLPVRLVENSIDGHALALTGEGELGDSLTRFINARGLEVRSNSSAFARLKRECQILHHERTGGYYGEIDARRDATVRRGDGRVLRRQAGSQRGIGRIARTIAFVRSAVAENCGSC